MKNTNKIVLVVMALVCIVLVGCPQPEQPKQEKTWTEVKSPDGLDGTWVSSYNMWLMVDRNTNTLVSSDIEVIWKIDEEKLYETQKEDFTSFIEKKAEITGKSESELWEIQKGQYSDYEEYFSYTDTKPYIETMNFEHDAKSVLEKRNPPVYVNADKTKLKVIMNFENVYDENGNAVDRTIELILVKK
jgi:hypothetical protein